MSATVHNINQQSFVARLNQLTKSMKRDHKLLTQWDDGDCEVYWYTSERGRLHWIQYGLQVTRFYDAQTASQHFGECIRHSIECAGRLDVVR